MADELYRIYTIPMRRYTYRKYAIYNTYISNFYFYVQTVLRLQSETKYKRGSACTSILEFSTDYTIIPSRTDFFFFFFYKHTAYARSAACLRIIKTAERNNHSGSYYGHVWELKATVKSKKKKKIIKCRDGTRFRAIKYIITLQRSREFPLHKKIYFFFFNPKKTR